MSKYTLLKVQKIEEKINQITNEGGLSNKESVLCGVAQYLIEYIHLLNDDNTDLKEDVEKLEFELDDKRFEDAAEARRNRPIVEPVPFNTRPRARARAIPRARAIDEGDEIPF